MSVAEYRRRSRKFYGFIGASVVFIPAVILCTVLGTGYYTVYQEKESLDRRLKELSSQTGYVLTQDVKSGERIDSSMLNPVTVYAKDKTCIVPVKESDLDGTYARASFEKGTVLYKQCVYEEQEYASDMRERTYSFMKINENITEGDYVDIRITYPDGEEYVVAQHKKVISLNRAAEQQETQELQTLDSICVNVNEEELLRIASAYVDTVFYPGSSVYVIAYLDRFQEPSEVNYPVNASVYELLGWNPNAISYKPSETEQNNRTVLEGHLANFIVEDVKSAILNEANRNVLW